MYEIKFIEKRFMKMKKIIIVVELNWLIDWLITQKRKLRKKYF